MSSSMQTTRHQKIRSAVVRFCGDSGDGMQLTGHQFSNAAGVFGNDIMTFPDFPAEIRAPQGSLAGVSGFQIQFAREDVFTPGDQLDVLVVINPAAFKTNVKDLRRGGTLILNSSSFDERNLRKAGYKESPLDGQEGEALKEKYSLFSVPISQLTHDALKGLKELTHNERGRCKNFFALGVCYWLFNRDLEYSLTWIKKKFQNKQLLIDANQKALKAGYYFAETSEFFSTQYEIHQAKLKPGLYRNINGASALSLGLLTAMQKSNRPLFYAGYPITPASEILHEMSRYRNYGVTVFQAEDEIAAASSAIGASYGGHIGVTASSGPGIMLKAEAINLAVMTELPLVIIDAQRGGPSTGLPTKTEQADLFLALFGRSSESPVPVVAPIAPGDSFAMIIEAVRLALGFMTPVFFLSDLYLVMGSEPWFIPDIQDISPIQHQLIREGEYKPENFLAYQRDAKTLARPWAIPGTAHLEHQIGGLEKDFQTGYVSYDPDNHEAMVRVRAQKIANIANFIPEQDVYGDTSGELLVLGWGSTYGTIHEAVVEMRKKGRSVSHAHLRYICPLPKNLKKLLAGYKKILLPEMNLGQLAFYLQAVLNIQVNSMPKVKGRPFLVSEIVEKIESMLEVRID